MEALKIATCCYCGARTALRLSGDASADAPRALACQSCGAPLTRLKRLKVALDAPASPRREPAHAAVKAPRRRAPQSAAQPRRRRGKKQPSLKRRFAEFFDDAFEDAWDALEDIFD